MRLQPQKPQCHRLRDELVVSVIVRYRAFASRMESITKSSFGPSPLELSLEGTPSVKTGSAIEASALQSNDKSEHTFGSD